MDAWSQCVAMGFSLICVAQVIANQPVVIAFPAAFVLGVCRSATMEAAATVPGQWFGHDQGSAEQLPILLGNTSSPQYTAIFLHFLTAGRFCW